MDGWNAFAHILQCLFTELEQSYGSLSSSEVAKENMYCNQQNIEPYQNATKG